MSEDYEQSVQDYQGGMEPYSLMDGGGLKRSADDSGMEGDGSQQVKRFCRGEGPSVELRVLIMSKNAGAIIGKAGGNIKRLRSTYAASVTVPDSNGPERILSINAPLGTVCECLRDVIPCFEDYQHFKPEDEFECELRLLVHQSQAGCVIGRGGTKIKELREGTGASIKVYSDCCPRSTDRVIQVHGNISKVIHAVTGIYDLLQSAPPKGPVNNYDPNFSDEFNAELYGGFSGRGRGGSTGSGRGSTSNFRGSPRSGSRGNGTRTGSNSTGGRNSPPRSLAASRSNFSDRSASRNSFGGNDRGSGNGGNTSFGGAGMGGGMSSGIPSLAGFGDQSFNRDPGPITKTQVSIPKDLAGAIIGKGGSRIKQIRQQSMAQIQIDEAAPGSNDRIITISGTQEQIQNAQYLLQLSVKQHANSSSRQSGGEFQ